MKKEEYQIHAAASGDLTEAQAQSVGAELLKIEKTNGGLEPPAVVDAARPKTAPLHQYFEWNNTAAAELHRQEQARRLIRSVVIVPVERPETQPVRAFVSVRGVSGPVYINTPKAMAGKDTRGEVLEKAARELKAWRDRYHELREFAEIVQAIDHAEALV